MTQNLSISSLFMLKFSGIHVEYYLFLLQLKAVFLNLVYFVDTSTFESTDSSSSTEDKMYKNYKYYGGTNWLAVFSVPLSLSNPSPTTKENATQGIQLRATGQRLLTNCPCCFTKCWLLWITIPLLMNLKNKSFSSTSPPSPLGSTCRKSTLPLMVLKESQGYLHPGKTFTNYLPISDIASSRHEHHPSHFSCS